MIWDRTKRIRAVRAHIGKTGLDLIAGSEVVLKPPRSSPPEGHTLIVLPASLGLDFLEHQDEIPDWVWEPARTGAGRLVIDASLEGYPHDIKRSHRLHRFLARAGIPRANAVYLTQDRGYRDAYHQVFAAEGTMRVLVHDYWIRAVVDEHAHDGLEVFEQRLEAYRARRRDRERRFLSLNRSLRASKTLFLLSLLREGLWDLGFVSTGGLEKVREVKGFSEDELEAELFRDAAFAELNGELRGLLPRLEALGRIQFEPPGAAASDPAMDQPLAEYGRSWFSVVTETEMCDRVLRITEKPLKPLMNFHPFIVLGNPGSLGLLRDYGFRSFPEMFDESYDDEPDPRRRFDLVFRDLQRLCALGESELDRLDRAVEEAVVHNARRALVELPRLFREELGPALIEEILAPPETFSPQSNLIAELA